MLSKKKISGFDLFIYVVLTILTLILAYPLYFVVIASFSEPYEVVKGNVFFWLRGFSLESYKNIFENSKIWVGYANSIKYTFFGTCLNLLLTIPAAYALSKPWLWKRGLLTTFFIIPMYFSGGLLPTYLQVRDMGLLNKSYTLIFLGGLSIYNLVVARTYFQSSIPDSLYEAAEIDGCSQFGQFFRIALPLSKPIIAVITLYYAVARWNDYYNSLVYVSSSKYHALQMVLRNILLESQNAINNLDMSSLTTEQMMSAAQKTYLAESMKYSVIFVASLPMLILYPFIQKYFVKGVMIGAVKG